MSSAIDLIIAVRELDVPGVAKSVLWALVSRTDAKGSCYPSYVRLAKDTGWSVRAVKQAVTDLAGRGLVTIERRRDDAGDAASNLYRLTLKGVVHQVHEVVQEVHHVVHDVPGGGARDARQVVQEVHGGGAPGAHEAIQLSGPSEAIQKKPSRRSAPAVAKKGSTGGLFGEQEPEKVPADHPRVIAAFVKAYAKTHGGTEPTLKGPFGKRVGKAASEMLAGNDVDTVIATIRSAFDDQYFSERSPTLWALAANFDRYKAKPKSSHPSFKPFPKNQEAPATTEERQQIWEEYQRRQKAEDVVPPPAGLFDKTMEKLAAWQAETVPEPYRAEHGDVQLPAFVNAEEIQRERLLIEKLEALRSKVILDEDDEDRSERLQNAEREIHCARGRIEDLDGTTARQVAESQRRNRELEAKLRARSEKLRPATDWDDAPGSEVFDGLPFEQEQPANASEVGERPSGMVPSAGPVKVNVAQARPVSETTQVGGRAGA